ncbi:hypothetical protein M5K25_025844 [Dendrobium thyrsiflorum]|uniref:Uncharacterized protein n=1 Tax=Dendrobium thyrsiflorum TaxID=117978 RepID=A0ABD0TVZ4_DENTH
MAMARSLLSSPHLLLCSQSREGLASKRNGLSPSSRLLGTRNFVSRGTHSHGGFAPIASMDSLLSRFLDRFYKVVQNFPLSTLLSRTPEIGKIAVPKFFCASTCCPATRKTVECYPKNPTRGSRAYSPSTHQSDSATSSPHHTAVTHFSASFVETNRGHYCGRDHPSLSNIRVAAPPYRPSPSPDGRPSIGFSFGSVSYDSPLGPTPSHLSQPLASPDLDSASEILVEKRIRKKRSPELETEYIHFVDANDITDNEDFFEDETEAITLGSLHDLNPDLGELEPLNFNALVNPEPNPIKDIPLDKVYLNDINLISKETDLTLSTMELNSEDSDSIITSTGLTSHNSELIVDNSDLDNLELGVTQESFLLDLHPDLSGPESIDLRIITKYDPIENINILLEDINLTLNNSEPNLEDEHPKILLESILGVAPLDLHLKECISPDLTYLNSPCTDLNESISPYLPVASLTVVPAFVLEALPHLLSPIPVGDSLGYPIIVMSHDPSPYRVPDSYILPSISPSFAIKDHLSPSWLTLLDYTTATGIPSTTLAETSYRNALDSLLSRFLDRFYKAVQNFPLSTLLSRTPEIGKIAVPKFFCASTCCPATRKTVECYPKNPTRGSRAYSPSTHQSDSATSSPHHTAVTHFSASFVETNRGHYCGRDHPSLSNIRVAAPPYRPSPSPDGRPSIGFSFGSVSYDSPLGPTPSHLSQPLASPDLDSASEILVEKRIRKKRSPELETEYIHFVDANDITDNEDFFEDETEAITLGSLHDLNPDLGELEPLNFNALVNPEPNPIKDIPLDKVYLNDINLISKETDLTLSTMELNSEDSDSIITSTGLTSHNSELIVDNSDLDNLELGVTQESFLLDLHPDLSGPESIDLRIITKYDPIENINILLEDINLTLNNSEPNLEDEHPKILLESILGVAPLDLHLKECISPDLTYLNSPCTDLNESISPYLPVASLTVVPAFVLEALPHLLSPIPVGDSLGYPIIVMSHDPSPYRVPDSYILPSISPSFAIKDHLSPSWLTLLDYTTATGIPSTTLAETSYRNALDSLLSRFLDRFYKAVQNFPLSTLLSRTPEIGKIAVPKFFCASTCCPATRKTVECYPKLERKAEKRKTVIPDPDFRIPIVLLVHFIFKEMPQG